MTTSFRKGRDGRQLWIKGLVVALTLLCGLAAWPQSKEPTVPKKLRDEIVDAVKKALKARDRPKPPPGSVRAPRGPASPTDPLTTIVTNADVVACSFWKQWIKSALDKAAQDVAQDGSTENLELYQKLWGFRSKILKACHVKKEGSDSATQPDPDDEVEEVPAGPETRPCCNPEYSEWFWAGWSLQTAERELKVAERRAREAEKWLEKYGGKAREWEQAAADYQKKASAPATTPEMREHYRSKRQDAEGALDMIKRMQAMFEAYTERATWLKAQVPSLRAAEKAAKARYKECIKTCVKKDKRVGLRLGEGEPYALVATRPTTGGRSSLLVSTSGSLSGLVVDEVRTTVDDEVVDDAEATVLPAGWEAERDGDDWVFTGPPLEDGEMIALGVDFTAAGDLPSTVDLQVLSDGVLLVDESVPVVALPAPSTVTSLKDILRLPQLVAPLETITFVPSNLVQTPLGGLWEIDGQPALPADWTAALTGQPSPGLAYTVPETWSPTATSTGPTVRYTDPWGELLVDAVAQDVALADASPVPAATPAITGCTPRAFVNSTICVCGSFPADSAHHVTLNGQPLGSPLSASSRVLNFALPEGQAPGPFEVEGASAGGFTVQDGATGAILQVGGSIDRERLLRGDSTPLALWVEGTEEVVELRLMNKTPQIISLEGGEDQVVATSGGADNRLQKTVRGLKAGPFNLIYELSTDPCPCAEASAASEPEVAP